MILKLAILNAAAIILFGFAASNDARVLKIINLLMFMFICLTFCVLSFLMIVEKVNV
jgi:hypothetical protein